MSDEYVSACQTRLEVRSERRFRNGFLFRGFLSISSKYAAMEEEGKGNEGEETAEVAPTSTSTANRITFYDGDACRYPAVRAAATKMGWRLVAHKDDASKQTNKQKGPQQTCNVLWVDVSILADYFLLMQPWQVINHFPGMANIARKTRLAQNLQQMQKAFPTHYNFSPQTYALPKDLTALRSQHFTLDKGRKSKHVWIIKPDGGAKGKGIFLTRDLAEIQNAIARSDSQYVAQRYIARPMLIDNKKFDLRLYVLITSCDPLRIYLFRDGLCRLCTVDYDNVGKAGQQSSKAVNLKDRCAHLTNYSVNKRSDAFVRDEECTVDNETGEIRAGGDCGSKRSVSWLISWLRSQHGDEVVDKLWCNIGDICVKTILSVLPTLVAEYRATFGVGGGCESGGSTDKTTNATSSRKLEGSRCFEILGVDILLDYKLQPYLIEVNHLPSFGTDAPLDKAIKSKVIEQAMSVVRAKPDDRRVYERSQRRKSRHRLVNRPAGSSTLGRLEPHEDDEVEEDERDAISNSTFRLHRSTSSPPHVLPPTAKAILESIYREHCPEKLNRVPAMLEKYRGYEDWLIAKVRERYCNSGDGSSNDGEGRAGSPMHKTFDGGDRPSPRDDEDEENCEHSNTELAEEERRLVDYDRIYPPQPSRKRPLPKPPYRAMEKHAFDESAKQVDRMTVPLHVSRANDADHEEGNTAANLAALALLTPQSSRGDYLHSGSFHLRRASGPVKIRCPPTKRQLQSFHRLSRGYHANEEATRQNEAGSTENSHSVTDSFTAALAMAEREASMLSTRRWDLVQRVRQELDAAKVRRQRSINQLDRSRLGVHVRSLDFDLGPLSPRLRTGSLLGPSGRDITNIHRRRFKV